MSRRAFVSALTKRYLLGLSLIAMLSASAYAMLAMSIGSQERMAAAINVSGRQRMLSQRIALTASEAARAKDSALDVALDDLIVEMRRAHETLVTIISPELDSRVRAYLDAAEKRQTEIVVATAMTGLIEELDAVVLALQREAEAKNQALQRAHTWLLALTLLLLVVEALWVFRPMTREALHALDEAVALSRKHAEQEIELAAATRMQARARLSSLGEMAAGVAHEIEGPLSIVQRTTLDLCQAVSSQRLDERRLITSLDTFRAMFLRMGRLVRALLLFARDDQREKLEVTTAAQLVTHAVALCRGRFSHAGVRLETDKIPPWLTLECRSSHIIEVLVSLLNNAFAAAHAAPSRWVRVGCTGDDTSIELSVTDSGAGVPPDLREKIMRPFFTTRPEGEAMGLGLSISFGIVAAHQGQIFVDERSRATRFVVRLPREHRGLAAVAV